ncbi:RNA polymerase sigma factor, sigma-70 family [Tenacibaculum sp. MAR_2009_124]|uniref:RNA polymerase sigma factor n=1 Tax=Tenacibaculum sp. MAR_2009_124 TaxID=1250059 RepID=UPI000897ECB1|nr:sigma-70 family RNA polymerase sigma factor [Tenacibaculum sp. MAR_2009_124]SEC24415.1 RNA polymerase sigma factor, sigma-70 family [Tenacibaculum sp. MAR_2009_124]
MLKKISVFSDEEIIRSLITNDEKENRVLTYLYKENYKSLSVFIKKNGGNSFDIDDIIQEAVIVFYENLKKGKFVLKTSVCGYIYSIGRFLWYKKIRNERKVYKSTSTGIEDLDFELQNLEIFSFSKTAFIKELFLHLGIGCQEILIQHIYQNMSMIDIAKLNGLKNEQAARNKKYKCLKKLKSIVVSSKRYQSLIKELD